MDGLIEQALNQAPGLTIILVFVFFVLRQSRKEREHQENRRDKRDEAATEERKERDKQWQGWIEKQNDINNANISDVGNAVKEMTRIVAENNTKLAVHEATMNQQPLATVNRQ